MISARAVAPAVGTPNPPLSEVSVAVNAQEIVVQLPASPDANHLIRIKQDTTVFRYPANNLSDGQPIVTPAIVISGVPLPAAGGNTVHWIAPEADTELATLLPGATVTCSATAEPDPSIIDTAVTNTVQQCDGRNVTVQLGHNAPTAAADVIQGTAAADTANGGGGNDRFCGLAGADTYQGGTGNDRGLGGTGNDTLRGGADNDRLDGGVNNDILEGGANNDICRGQTGGGDTATGCETRTGIP